MPDRFGGITADKRRMTISLLTLSRPPFFNYQYGIFHPKYLIRNNPYGHSNRILPTKHSLRNVPFEILHSESINPKQSIRNNQCELFHSITRIEYSLRNIPYEILPTKYSLRNIPCGILYSTVKSNVLSNSLRMDILTVFLLRL